MLKVLPTVAAMKPGTLAMLRHELMDAEGAQQRRSELGLSDVTEVTLAKFQGSSRTGGATVFGEARVTTRGMAGFEGQQDRIAEQDVTIFYEADCYYDKPPELRLRVRPSA